MTKSALGGKPCRALIGIASVVAMQLLVGCANTLMLHPELARIAARQHPVHPDHGDEPESVAVTNRAGCRLTGWVFDAPGNHGVVLLGDGNASGIAHTYAYNRHLLGRGFNLVILSYQGYDANEGQASLDSLFGDTEAFYNLCRQRFPGQPIALVGESLSTGVFLSFASRHPEIACLVLEGVVDLKNAPFTVVHSSWALCLVYPFTGPLALVVRAGVPAELSGRAALRRGPQMPALFIHHPQDRVTPYRGARRLFDQYPGPKEMLVPQIADGNDLHMTGNSDPRVRSAVVGFLQHNLQEKDQRQR